MSASLGVDHVFMEFLIKKISNKNLKYNTFWLTYYVKWFQPSNLNRFHYHLLILKPFYFFSKTNW